MELLKAHSWARRLNHTRRHGRNIACTFEGPMEGTVLGKFVGVVVGIVLGDPEGTALDEGVLVGNSGRHMVVDSRHRAWQHRRYG